MNIQGNERPVVTTIESNTAPNTTASNINGNTAASNATAPARHDHAKPIHAKPDHAKPVDDLPPAPLRFARPTSRSGPSTRSLGERVRAELESRLGKNKVRRYLGQGVEMGSDADGFLIAASDRFTLDMIQMRIGDELRQAIQNQGDPSIKIRFAVKAKSPTACQGSSLGPTPGRQAGITQGKQGGVEGLVTGLAPQHGPTKKSNLPSCPKLSEFIVGRTNQLAWGAINTLLESSGNCPPVFVHSSCGLGKTHLLRGAAQKYRQMIPGSRVRYITGEAFTNSFVQAVRTKTVDAFEKKFRGLDVLCLDDVHLVAGKEGTQHELLQIFNTLSLSGAKIVIASDAPPGEIARLHSALSSRFAAGVVARIDAPDRELGMKLARHICMKRGVSIDDSGLGTILERIGVGSGTSVRELEGAIVQVQAVARLLDQDQGQSHGTSGASGALGTLSLASIHRALGLRDGSGHHGRSKGPIPIDLISRVVTEHLGVTRQDLIGNGRHRTVVLARELIVHLSRQLTTSSFPEIAHAIGRPNHSTVITAAKRIKGRIENLDLCVHMGPECGVTVRSLAEQLTERVRQTHQMGPGRG